MSDAPHRIHDHAVLGALPSAELVTIIVDDEPLVARSGEPLAATLLAHGRRICRTTARMGEARGVFCAVGLCGDCAMQVDGIPGVRTCVTPARQGMVVRTQHGLGVWEPTQPPDDAP